MNIIRFDQLAQIREKHSGQRIVFCSGSFDLTHAGHVLFLEEAKSHGDILVVMVGNDHNMRLYKGENRPVLNEHLRLKMVSSLKPVDYALLDLDAVDGDILALFPRVFGELKPDVYVINQDAQAIPRLAELLRGHNTQTIILDRTCPDAFENISTTKIIEKIKRL